LQLNSLVFLYTDHTAMSISNKKKEGVNSNFSSPILSSLMSSQNIYILTFDVNGQILEYSNGLKNILAIDNEFYFGKNIDALPLSKSEKPLVLLNFISGFPTSQKIYDVKLITSQGRILTMNLNVELSFQNENFVGGIIQFEEAKQNASDSNTFNNILSQSKFILKEPLRISKLFAQKLGEKITDEEPTKKEYLDFIISNISSLDSLVNHLIILENLNIYHLDLKSNKFEELLIVCVQKIKNIKVDFENNKLPKQILCDRDLMKLLIKLVIEFSNIYSTDKFSFLKIEGENLNNETKITFKMGMVSFLNHPSFAPNRPLKRIGNLKASEASGYELVIINQIVGLHKGNLKISLNQSNETEIEINLPNH